MSRSTVRERTAPQKRSQRNNNKGKVGEQNGQANKNGTKKKNKRQTGIRISVEDLRQGDRIVTSWHSRPGDLQKPGRRQMSIDEVLDVLRGDGEESTRFVNNSFEVKQITECASQWRTHVHINKSSCYDMRGYVWIVDVKKSEEEEVEDGRGD